MAVDDVSFYNVFGEEISRTSLVNQMIGFFQLLREAGETKITDFNEGSVIRNILESVAVDHYIILEDKNELTKIGFIDSAEGEWLDQHGRNPFIRLERDMGMEANGSVTFTVPSAPTSETVIPEGTVVVNSNTGLEYVTLADAVLGTDETSVTVSVECLTTGEDGNCKIGEIDTIEDMIADIPELTVTNTNKITGGSDYEEDDEYRERLLSYVRRDDFGSLLYYINLADEIEGVHDVNLIEDDMTILVNGTIKPTPSSVLSEVAEVYTDLNNRVIGHNFTISKPTYITVNLSLDLGVSVEVSSELIESLLGEIFDGGGTTIPGFEFDGYNIGDDVMGEVLKSNLLLIEDIETVSIKVTGESEELDTISIGDDEVAKLGTVTLNQTIIT